MARSLFSVLVLIFFVATNFGNGQSTNEAKYVTTTGTGSVKIPADQAIINFQIVTTADTVQEAYAFNDKISSDVLNSLRSVEGVNGTSDIQLLNFAVQPHQQYIKNSTFEGYVQLGYDVTRDVTITVDDVDLVPSITATIIEQGGNAIRLNSVQYTLQDATRSSAELNTLTLATNNSHQRAIAIVSALPGLRLGIAKTANEGSIISPSPVLFSSMKLAASPSSTSGDSFSPGLITIQSSVSTVFEMVPTA